MIKSLKLNLQRNKKTVKGTILYTGFFLNKSPTGLKSGRGFSKAKINDRFLILSTDFPKINILGTKEDYSIALHVWGIYKSKDNIEIKKEFPTVEIAKDFMNVINNFK